MKSNGAAGFQSVGDANPSSVIRETKRPLDSPALAAELYLYAGAIRREVLHVAGERLAASPVIDNEPCVLPSPIAISVQPDSRFAQKRSTSFPSVRPVSTRTVGLTITTGGVAGKTAADENASIARSRTFSSEKKPKP